MKIIKYLVSAFLFGVLMFSCTDDEKELGNPVLEIKSQFEAGFFGDSIPFTVGVSDQQSVPLSTVKLKLFFGEEMVSEKVIRTKTEGDYSGKLYVPFYPNIPNGNAQLEIILQNVNMTIVKQTIDLPLSRPDFPYVMLVSGGNEIRMDRVADNEYEATQDFPAKVPGYIKAPAFGVNGNEITFGWESGAIKEYSKNDIPFSNIPGNYAIHFNTFDYSASPFIVAYAINGVVMSRVDDEHFFVDAQLAQGDAIEVEGIDGFDDWWVDPDYFTSANGVLNFKAINGKYRLTADFANQYLKVETMSGNGLASLQPDGSGALWILGDGAGKPNLANSPGWSPGRAICLAPIGGKKYQVTFVAGKTIDASNINFKFFHQNGWGGEYKSTTLSSQSDIVFVGDGTNGRDSGNLGIFEGKALEGGATYVFVVDVSAGIDQAVLTVTKK